MSVVIPPTLFLLHVLDVSFTIHVLRPDGSLVMGGSIRVEDVILRAGVRTVGPSRCHVPVGYSREKMWYGVG